MREGLTGFPDLVRLHLARVEELEAARRQERLREERDALDARLQTTREALAAAEADVARLQSERRVAEGEVERLEAARGKYRSQLMEAKTNEVYRTLLHEIEVAGQSISDRETVVLELMEGLDAARGAEARTREELRRAEAENAAEAKRLGAEAERLEHVRVEAASRAAAIEPAVPGELLTQYRRVADSRGGRGLARVEERTCVECRVAIRPQVWVELIAPQELHTCPGCYRILFRADILREGSSALPPEASSQPSSADPGEVSPAHSGEVSAAPAGEPGPRASSS